MIDPVFLIALVIYCGAICRVLSPRYRMMRLVTAALPGLFILLYINISSFYVALFTATFSAIVFFVCRRLDRPGLRSGLPYVILLLIFVPDWMQWQQGGALLLLGSAFFIVRQFMTVKDALRNNASAKDFFCALILGTLFFPALFVGPIFSGWKAWQELGEAKNPPAGDALFRVLEGFVFLAPVAYYVAVFRRRLDTAAGNLGEIPGFMIEVGALPVVAFGFIFVTFYGYSRIAEGAAMLMGFHVPENFNRPWLTRDFADFWKRWHRSMADFVMQYIYLPLSIHTRRPRLAMVCAFLAMGVWHEPTPGYITWGILHGLAVGWLNPLLLQRNLPSWVMRIIALTGIIWVSYLANHWMKVFL